MPSPPESDSPPSSESAGANIRLSGQRVAILGKLASMPKREATQIIRKQGGMLVDAGDSEATMLIVGEGELPLDDQYAKLLRSADEAASASSVTILNETQLWQRLGLLDSEQDVHRLYTPAILADLVGVPVSVIRRWHRRGLIVPAREVRRLPYFDFQEVAAARHLAALLAAGVKPKEIERKLADLARYLPNVERPLAQLSVIVQGKELLLRQGSGLLTAGGQRLFDFDADDSSAAAEPVASLPMRAPIEEPEPKLMDAASMLDAAAELEEEGRLLEAADMYRSAMAAGGPNPEACFLLAELLYRVGDLSAARERYYMAIELDENYVEARANLGCVLQEMGQQELAVAAWEGALTYHGEYPDAHYHLARALQEAGRADEARPHWEAFADLVPDSPWAAEAQSYLQRSDS